MAPSAGNLWTERDHINFDRIEESMSFHDRTKLTAIALEIRLLNIVKLQLSCFLFYLLNVVHGLGLTGRPILTLKRRGLA